MNEIEKRIGEAVAYIRARTAFEPEMGLVLGSGLGDFAEKLDAEAMLDFAEIPGFPVPTVEGHAGKLVLGSTAGRRLAALSGRVHAYEGRGWDEITIPVRVMRRLGVHTLLLTNAAGGVNLGYSQGALMLISDHINLTGKNPLTGPNLGDFGPRFPDMSEVYSAPLRRALLERAAAAGIELKEGVYMMYPGPSYETPAEIRAFRSLGADAVGMSTVPEAIAARHAGMRVIGISCITNMAAGVAGTPLSHSEVVETATRVKGAFLQVVGMAIEIGAGL